MLGITSELKHVHTVTVVKFIGLKTTVAHT